MIFFCPGETSPDRTRFFFWPAPTPTHRCMYTGVESSTYPTKQGQRKAWWYMAWYLFLPHVCVTFRAPRGSKKGGYWQKMGCTTLYTPHHDYHVIHHVIRPVIRPVSALQCPCAHLYWALISNRIFAPPPPPLPTAPTFSPPPYIPYMVSLPPIYFISPCISHLLIEHKHK